MKQEISKAISSTAYQTYEKLLFKEVSEGDIPHHIAVIMDGNRRFAKELGISSTEGHIKGKDKLEEVLDWCMELDIKILTVYAFSTENGKRSAEEVSALMDLFEENFIKLFCLRVFAAIPLRVRSRSFRFVHASIPPRLLKYVLCALTY